MRLAPITGLFGANSSGKSSILQLLLLLKQTIESSDRAQVLEFGDEKSLTSLGGFSDLVYEHDTTSSLEFSFGWSLGEPLEISDPETKGLNLFETADLRFTCRVQENGGKRLAVGSLEYGFEGHQFGLQMKSGQSSRYKLTSLPSRAYHFKRSPGRAWDLPTPIKFHGFPDQVYTYYQNAGFLADLQRELEKLLAGVRYLGPLREFPRRDYRWMGSEPGDMGRRGERVVDAMLAARAWGPYLSEGRGRTRKTLEVRTALWLKNLGLVHDFSVEEIEGGGNLYRVKVKRTRGSAEVLITDVGFGVSQILPVLVLCYYVPEGSIILLEQPEIHLHPSVQSGLADVFVDAVKHRGIQIIFESHSEHLLRRLQRHVAEKTLAPEEAALYFCEMGDQGSQLRPLELDLLGNIRNWPTDFFGDEFGEMAAITRAQMKQKQARVGTQ